MKGGGHSADEGGAFCGHRGHRDLTDFAWGSGALELTGPLHRADTVWPSLLLLLVDPLPLAGSEGIGATAPTPMEAETEGAGPQSSQDQEGPVSWVWRQEVCGS